MAKSKISKTSANLISDILYETLKRTISPEQREVLLVIHDEIIREWDRGNISMEQSLILTNCFDREKEETENTLDY